MTNKYLNMNEDEILANLKEMYSNDEDALDYITRTEIDLEYMNSDRYNGTQTPKQHLLELAAFLMTWY